MHDAHDAGPVKFKLGEHKVIAGMEEAVLNMRVGEKKTTQLQPDAVRTSQASSMMAIYRKYTGTLTFENLSQAFGDIRPELILYIPASKVPAEVFADVKCGQMISLTEEAQAQIVKSPIYSGLT